LQAWLWRTGRRRTTFKLEETNLGAGGFARMTQLYKFQVYPVHVRTLTLALAAAVLAAASPALAQQHSAEPPGQPTDPDHVEAWHNPPATPAKPRNATSDISATEPTASEQREARKLATAIFAAPSAGQRAADKAAPPAVANVPPGQPKAEWLADEKVGPGGQGLQVKAPF
jgi:hypothetical protein